MTAHSPIGLQPNLFSVKKVTEAVGSFANNDIEHIDPLGTQHESFGFGLKKALLNYMHAACFDTPLQKWFDFKVPKTSVAPDFIRKAIEDTENSSAGKNSRVLWLGKQPKVETIQKSKKGNHWEVMSLTFQTKKAVLSIHVEPAQGAWLESILPKLSIYNPTPLTLQMIKADYENAGLEDFELFWDNKPVNTLYKAGLLRL
jgi:hypothetical protein